MVYAYGATMIEVVRRKEFGVCHGDVYFEGERSNCVSAARLCHRKSQGFSEVMSNLSYVYQFLCTLVGLMFCHSAAETQRRQAFRDEILEQLPFDLIGMDETLPTVGISVSEGECTNSHYTLERRDINGVYPSPSLPDIMSEMIRRSATRLERLAAGAER